MSAPTRCEPRTGGAGHSRPDRRGAAGATAGAAIHFITTAARSPSGVPVSQGRIAGRSGP